MPVSKEDNGENAYVYVPDSGVSQLNSQTESQMNKSGQQSESPDDYVADAEDKEEEEEENRNLQQDSQKLWVQIDGKYYLTSDRYNPVILVRFTHDNLTRKSDGTMLNNRKWYFASYEKAIGEYVHQKMLEDNRSVKDHRVEVLKNMAHDIDTHFQKGLEAVAEFDKKYQQIHPDKVKHNKDDVNGGKEEDNK